MDNSRLKLWFSFIKFFLGTFLLSLISILVKNSLDIRRIEINEQQQLQNYANDFIPNEIGIRLRYAQYYATISRSKDIRVRWTEYVSILQKEYDLKEQELKNVYNYIDSLRELDQPDMKLVNESVSKLQKISSQIEINESKMDTKSIEDLRIQLKSGVLNREKILELLTHFGYNELVNTSIEEAKLMMAFLSPDKIFQRDKQSVSGSFGDYFEITIWPNTYNKKDTYGIRYGIQDVKYWATNESYIEIKK